MSLVGKIIVNTISKVYPKITREESVTTLKTIDTPDFVRKTLDLHTL